MHPLSGADIGTLWSVFNRSGGIPADRWPAAAAIIGAAIGRQPFSLLEKLALAGALPKTSDMPPPVFIVGHWRSGTTHLYNVMAKDRFGYVPPLATGLPWDLMGLARALRPFLEKALPEHRFIDNVPVNPDSPQEDEIAIANMSPLSFYHAIYFPQAFDDFLGRGLFFDGCTAKEIEGWRRRFEYFMAKLYLHQDRKRLLIKNPVYTARVALLHEIFPEARFIHIYRNPYEVFVSMQNFWKKLLKEFALQPYDYVDIDEVILGTYTRMMSVLEDDLATLPDDLHVELRYDTLDSDPLGSIHEIYDTLEIGGFYDIRPTFEAYLESVRNYEKNRFTLSTEDAELVEERWGHFLSKWGYERPAPQEDAADA